MKAREQNKKKSDGIKEICWQKEYSKNSIIIFFREIEDITLMKQEQEAIKGNILSVRILKIKSIEKIKNSKKCLKVNLRKHSRW